VTPPMGPIVATDGSHVGLGVVAHRGYEVAQPAPLRALLQPRAEARAACLGLSEAIRVAAPPCVIVLLNDNLGLAYRLSRWAAPPHLADAILWMWRTAEEARVVLRVGWISGVVMDSLANPASRSTVAYRVHRADRDLTEAVARAFFPPSAGAIAPVRLPFV